MSRYLVTPWILPVPSQEVEKPPWVENRYKLVSLADMLQVGQRQPRLIGEPVLVDATTPHTAAYRALTQQKRDGRPVPIKLQRGETLYLEIKEVASA